MELTFAPNGIVQINDARICYRNFSGTGSKYNREGDRNFAVIIDTEEMADALAERGWNVKVRPPRDVDDEPFRYLSVKCKFNANGPHVYLVSGTGKVKLDEETVGILDKVSIANVDLDIRPYDCEVNGKEWRSAYLYAIQVTQRVDRFADNYEDDYSLM